MPIYEYRLTFFLEKDDYYCGEHFSDRLYLTELLWKWFQTGGYHVGVYR